MTQSTKISKFRASAKEHASVDIEVYISYEQQFRSIYSEISF